jgi:type II secretory pathway component GspD/PulD (secretin)
VIVERLLERTAVPYLLDGPAPSGVVTSRFEAVPLEKAVNLLLEGQGLTARFQDGILRIEGAPVRPAPAAAPPGTDIRSAPVPSIQEIPLSHLDTASAAALLDGLYPSLIATGTRNVQFGSQPSTNSMVLLGSEDQVAAAAMALRRADRKPEHVMIEALVVEFDANALEQLGLDLASGARGNVGDVATAFGSLVSKALTFSYSEAASNPLAFTALLDALAAQDKARLISRPYLATLSGQPASIDISRQRFVIVESAQNGATVTTANPIPSGVTLKITPFVTESGTIRMDIDVTDSQFIPTVENVAVEVDSNHATTTMLVESGQTISIGGLVLNRDSFSDSGLPLLRSVPGLNLLFGKRKKDSQKQEVVIYITPHVWQPGVDSPLPFDQGLRIKENAPRIRDPSRPPRPDAPS